MRVTSHYHVHLNKQQQQSSPNVSDSPLERLIFGREVISVLLASPFLGFLQYPVLTVRSSFLTYLTSGRPRFV